MRMKAYLLISKIRMTRAYSSRNLTRRVIRRNLKLR